MSATTAKMPVLFIGHGNPMHALADNGFTRMLAKLGQELPTPRAVLCVSAHWMTEGSWVTRMPKPKTIHDFYGFPDELFAVKYAAPGSPEVADLVRATVIDPKVQLDEEMWGFDHGSWAVLRHMYPAANVPVLQLSIYMEQPSPYHFKLGEQLRPLREKGVLIVGSGNIVHNLRQMNWKERDSAYDWATEFDEWVKAKIKARDFAPLLEDFSSNRAAKLSVPSPDHYYPLLYALGASDERDSCRFEYEGIEHGSISMTAVSFGR